jgi:hypothetical protein
MWNILQAIAKRTPCGSRMKYSEPRVRQRVARAGDGAARLQVQQVDAFGEPGGAGTAVAPRSARAVTSGLTG